MKRNGQATPIAAQSGGQAALILIMVMAVIGVVSVGVASKSVENLRSTEIENTSVQSFKAAEAALELALSTKQNVGTATFPGGEGSYSATYSEVGTDGFVSDQVEAGDVVQANLVGASAGLTGLNVYWNSDAAVMVSVLDYNGASYSVSYSAADPNVGRTGTNHFSTPAAGGTFKTVTFTSMLLVPVTANTKLVRVKVLYSSSSVGIQPVGGTLPSQALSISAVGTAQGNIKTNLLFSKYSDRVPVIFDNVLYTRDGSLSQ